MAEKQKIDRDDDDDAETLLVIGRLSLPCETATVQQQLQQKDTSKRTRAHQVLQCTLRQRLLQGL